MFSSAVFGIIIFKQNLALASVNICQGVYSFNQAHTTMCRLADNALLTNVSVYNNSTITWTAIEIGRNMPERRVRKAA